MKRKGKRNVPWKVILPVAHLAYDLATNASCPRCDNRVVLYVCTRCRRPVKPNRRDMRRR